jgi:trehalose 6-phosphate phosphatase
MQSDRNSDIESRIEMHGDLSMYAFFLDIDGTLVDIADAPDCVEADLWLLDIVQRLHLIAGGALALISGRAVAEVDRLFAPMRLPIAGQHGVERRDATGKMHHYPHCTQQLDDLRYCISARAAEFSDLLVEDKGMSIAVHYRQAPHLSGEVHKMLSECLLQCGDAFRLQEGKMVLELKPAGMDKGTAIIEFMNEEPFHGRIPVFVGDDATDEYGFVAVNNHGGHSVKVGPGPSAACWRVSNVAAVRIWLEELLGQLEPTREDI